jgi:hypothetical protein
MFTPDQERAARELARVCRAGGLIGLASWTPDGFIGQLFKLIGRYLPPPAGLSPPSLWGTEERLEQLFGPAARRIRAARREFVFRYRSPLHWVEVFRTYYGPLTKAFGALDGDAQTSLTRELLALIESRNRGDARSLVLPSDYLEVVIERC